MSLLDASPYATVAVGRPLRGEFTYLVPAGLRGKLKPGQRVRVPFGRATALAFFLGDAAAPAADVAAKLKAAGLRAEVDTRNEKINYKVREHSLAKVPLLLVVGKREAEEGTVAVRRLGSDEHQKVMGLDEAIAAFAAEATPPDLRG